MTDPARIQRIAAAVRECAAAWEPGARLIGNVTADEIRELAIAAEEYAEGMRKACDRLAGRSAIKWDDDADLSEADCGEMVLVVWPDDMHSRNFCWRVSLMPGTGEIDVDNGTAADRDAAKAAAIAAARAWRDSIRL